MKYHGIGMVFKSFSILHTIQMLIPWHFESVKSLYSIIMDNSQISCIIVRPDSPASNGCTTTSPSFIKSWWNTKRFYKEHI